MKLYRLVKLMVHYFKVVYPSMNLKEYFKYHKMIINLEKSF